MRLTSFLVTAFDHLPDHARHRLTGDGRLLFARAPLT